MGWCHSALTFLALLLLPICSYSLWALTTEITWPDIQVPQSCLEGHGQYWRLLEHPGRSSEAKDSKKKVKRRWMEGLSKSCMQQKTTIGKFVMGFVKCQWSIGKWMLPLLSNLTGLVNAVYQALMHCKTFILLSWSHLHIVDFILNYEKMWLIDKQSTL